MEWRSKYIGIGLSIFLLACGACDTPKSIPKMPAPAGEGSVGSRGNIPIEVRIKPYDPVAFSEVSTPGKLTVNFSNLTNKPVVAAIHPYFLKLSFLDDSGQFIKRASRKVPDEKLRKLPPEMVVVIPPGNTIAREVPVPLEAPTDYESVFILARLDPVTETQLTTKAKALVRSYHATYPKWKGGLWSNKTPAKSNRIEE